MGELSARIGAPPMGRRAFLRAAGATAGVFSLEFPLFGEAQAATSSGSAHAAPAQHVLNAYVSIHPDNSIVLFAKNPDCGQGIKTTFGMILAEELDADWNLVRVEQSPVAAAYGTQSSGGSNSTPTNWDALRQAGATARAMLISAAAARWQVPASSLTTRDSVVVHAESSRRLTYGELAAEAMAQPLPPPESLVLKRRGEFKLLGTRVGNIDNLSVVKGLPLFGVDVDLPGMLHAVLERCPARGGKPVSANLEEILALPGIRAAFFVKGWPTVTATRDAKEPPGVAIVGNSTWAVLSARKKLKVVWDESEAATESWSELTALAKAQVGMQGPTTLSAAGSVEKLAGKRVSAFYMYANAAHATLEPQNATASWKDGKIEIWAPTQTPTAAVAVVAASLGIKPEAVTLHVCRLGGGFGRRLVNDYVCEAAVISRQVGAPVKLMWTREDDMRHDYFRAGGFHAVDGWIDGKGKLAGWQNHFITMTLDGKTPVTGGALRANEFPATLLPNHRITQTMFPVGTAFGSWRAPGSNAWAFVSQSFVHELAVAAGRDHLEFLLEMFRNAPPPKPDIPDNELNPVRAIAVIEEVARRAGWGSKQPAGQALGLAFYFSHRGHFAEVVRVSVDARKKITLHEIWAVGDIGPVLNRSGAEAQVQGSVNDAVSVMMSQRIDIEKGRIRQANFDSYPLLRMPSAPPAVHMHFIESDRSPTGCGEPALPPLAPAVCNAIFTLTGARIRELPLSNLGYSI